MSDNPGVKPGSLDAQSARFRNATHDTEALERARGISSESAPPPSPPAARMSASSSAGTYTRKEVRMAALAAGATDSIVNRMLQLLEEK